MAVGTRPLVVAGVFALWPIKKAPAKKAPATKENAEDRAKQQWWFSRQTPRRSRSKARKAAEERGRREERWRLEAERLLLV